MAAATAALGLLGFGLPAAATIMITFDEPEFAFVHGSVVLDQYEASLGVTITAISSFNRGIDTAVTFDTNSPSAIDPDLVAGAQVWSGGNLDDVLLGNVLILNKNTTGCGDGICDVVDDDGRRPAGDLIFDFTDSVLSFGFDIVDVDNLTMENGFLTLEGGGLTSGPIAFSTLLDPNLIGDNTANRIAEQFAADYGLSVIERAYVRMGGSGGIDNIAYVVPEPGTAGLVGLGLVVLAGRSRRRSA